LSFTELAVVAFQYARGELAWNSATDSGIIMGHFKAHFKYKRVLQGDDKLQ
jgi:hypothetical protein